MQNHAQGPMWHWDRGIASRDNTLDVVRPYMIGMGTDYEGRVESTIY